MHGAGPIPQNEGGLVTFFLVTQSFFDVIEVPILQEVRVYPKFNRFFISKQTNQNNPRGMAEAQSECWVGAFAEGVGWGLPG